MILQSRLGNREIRSEWGSSSRIPLPGQAWLSDAGLPVTQEKAYGLPAVSNVIRSPAEVIASMPFIVYERGEPRQRAEDSWQWQLLHEQPAESLQTDTFEFFYDLALSLEATQNAFVQKAKQNGRVWELYVLDPQRIHVKRDRATGRKEFYHYTPDGAKEIPADQILHIRGFTPEPGGICGVSLVQVHRDPLGAQIAMQAFEGDYFRNSAQAPFFFTGALTKQQAEDVIDIYNAKHRGPGNQWKPGALFGEMDVKQLPLSMEDSMFVEAKRLSIEDACRIWRWPKQLLELGGEAAPVDENAWTARFLKFYLLPRLKRIERAFAADPDIFPRTGPGSGRASGARLFGEFLTASLERADFVTRVRGYKDARQGGWITSNEIRQAENLPERPDGDSLLQTPTGSAPNPQGPPEPEEPEPGERMSNGQGDHRNVAALVEE